MRSAILEDVRRFAVREVLEPVLENDEVLIKVQYCGICGSDLHVYEIGGGTGPGHEFSGDIVEVGPDVKGWGIGDRVAVMPRTSCGECYWCRRGEGFGLCEEFDVVLAQYEGAFRTYAKAKYGQLHKLPGELSYEHATLIEPTTCALHAIRLSGMKEGDVVAVLGLGPIGQLVARLAKALGAKAVYAAEKSQSRVELARDVADEVINVNVANPVDRILELTGGMGPDIVFECAGNVSTTQESIALVRKGGTIVVAGICSDAVEIPFGNIVLRGLTIKGFVGWSADNEYASALNLIKDKKIDVAPLLTCKMPLDEINEAFGKALRGEGGKILIKP